MRISVSPRLVRGAAVLTLSALTAGASATPVFEKGIPAGWSCVGRCGTAGADGDVPLAPGGGEAYGWIATSGSHEPNGAGALPHFDVPGGSETDGSRLTSPLFSAQAGEPLELQFNYVTSDGGSFADYAWARLLNGSGEAEALLFTARTSPDQPAVPGFDMPAPEATTTPASVNVTDSAPAWSPLGRSSGDCWDDEGCGLTGWVGSSLAIAEAGDYALQLGVTNWGDHGFQSGLAFDAPTVGGAPLRERTVPAPTTVLLLGAGLLGIGSACRRSRRGHRPVEGAETP